MRDAQLFKISETQKETFGIELGTKQAIKKFENFFNHLNLMIIITSPYDIPVTPDILSIPRQNINLNDN